MAESVTDEWIRRRRSILLENVTQCTVDNALEDVMLGRHAGEHQYIGRDSPLTRG